MYNEIQETKRMKREDAILRLSKIETQIHTNISEIKNSTFVSVANLDPESCKDVHKMLLNEVERVRNLILKR